MDRDTPTDLDDTSWLAIEGGTVEAICQTLALSDPRPATWAHGMDVVGGCLDGCPRGTDKEMVGVFLTPLIRGSHLVVGPYVGAAPLAREADDLRNSWRRVAGWCRRLTRNSARPTPSPIKPNWTGIRGSSPATGSFSDRSCMMMASS